MIAFAWDEQGEPVSVSEFSTGARSLSLSLYCFPPFCSRSGVRAGRELGWRWRAEEWTSDVLLDSSPSSLYGCGVVGAAVGTSTLPAWWRKETKDFCQCWKGCQCDQKKRPRKQQEEGMWEPSLLCRKSSGLKTLFLLLAGWLLMGKSFLLFESYFPYL